MSASSIETEEAALSAILHSPRAPSGDGLVLTHGAGSDRDAPLLRALGAELAERGLTVLRCNLRFRQLRPKGPPGRGDGARDRAGLVDALGEMRRRLKGRVLLGGHSYGGRQSSLLLADEPALASGLLLLSYPLHPPGKPTELRTAHFSRLTTRTLFVSGSTDPFGTLDELEAARALIPSETALIVREGAGHDLLQKRDAAQAAQTIAAAFFSFFSA
jgi:hypothetical protein